MLLIVVGALGTDPKGFERTLEGIRKSEEESRPYRPQMGLDTQKRPEKTCCHSNSSEKLLVKIHVRNLQGMKWFLWKSWDFESQMDDPILTRRSNLILINKKRTWQRGDFTILAEHWVKIKESEKLDKCLNLDGALNNLWNKKMAVIPVKRAQRDWRSAEELKPSWPKLCWD